MSDDLHIKPEMSDGFINIHEMILKSRIERLKAQAYSDLEEAAWTDAALAWVRALPTNKDITDTDRLIDKCAKNVLLARSYKAKKEKAIDAQEAFENAADETPSDEVWTKKTIDEFNQEFGENASKADLATRRLLSLIGEHDVIKKMQIEDASSTLRRLESEMATLMRELESLKKKSPNQEN